MYFKTFNLIIKKYPFLRYLFYPAIAARQAFLNQQRSKQEFIFNHLNQLLVEDPLIKVDEFEGVFILDCRSDLFKRLIIHKEYEPELVKHCLRLLDIKRDVIDVGANIGFFSVLFAKHLDSTRVLAIEPTQRAFARLQRNLSLNKVEDKVILFNGVSSNKNQTTQIKVVKGKEEYSSLGNMAHPAIINEGFSIENIVSKTLDELMNQYSLNVGFIKVDVEGAEHLVFEGATTILSNQRPIVISELSDYLLKQNGSSALEVIRFIQKYDYEVIDPLNPEVPVGKEKFGNILCIPK